MTASLSADRFTESDFRVGQVLSRTWSVLSRNVLKFSMVMGFALLPIVLLFWTVTVDNAGNPFRTNLASWAGYLFILLSMLCQAVVFHGAFQHMLGRPVNLFDGVKVSLGRFFSLIGLGLVFVLVLIGFVIVGAALLFVVPGLRYAIPLLIILIAMLYLAWSMATPACVVEWAGPFRSLARSRALTKGHRWKILGLLLVTVLGGVIIGAIVGATSGAILALIGAGGLRSALSTVIGLIWEAVWLAFFAVLTVVTYHDLRVAKEGVNTDQIAAVFE